ncbi:low temperature requirement protein A [Streptomyces sp. H39-S7]|uniref:low temperature requirement protein A n=1 Tax=Streptomyces sp. H39-S7 TaxID=3004357 RepID=UPI0022B05B35|nr:low temperature requirement protein A [Streptomyces sp. H39-S7]MCZ4123442.1 low temperature requirement protein A [Streptomyces sp. H39-S7]
MGTVGEAVDPAQTDPEKAGGGAGTAEEPDKQVSWAELFFDLVYVFAITEVSSLLQADHSWAGTGRALIVFVPAYWAWTATSVHANRQDVENAPDRLGIFAVALCALFMGLAVPGAYGDRGLLFGASYWVARLVLQGLALRWQHLHLNSFLVSAVVTGPLLLAGGLVEGNARIALWAAAALVDTLTPQLLRRRTTTHFHSGHLPERFGLFLIVALGETIIAIGSPVTGTAHISGGVLATVAAAFVLTAALWWVYFAFAASAMRFAVAAADKQFDMVRHVLSYAHLGLISAVIATAVGLHDAVAHPGHRLGAGAAALLYGGCGLFLLVFVYTRRRMFRLWSVTRLTAAAAVLVSLPLASRLPALGAVLWLAGLIVALDMVEWYRMRRAAARAGTEDGAEAAAAAAVGEQRDAPETEAQIRMETEA